VRGKESHSDSDFHAGGVISSPIVVLKHDPYNKIGDSDLEFRLTYEGILLGASRSDTRAKHKQEIRKVFHAQLKRFWEIHPAFESYQPVDENTSQTAARDAKHKYDALVERYARCGYNFVPIATRTLSVLCSINILFLRPDVPGAILQSGDIDNRLKTIFDALRLPRDKNELGGFDTPADGEDPFFCLLEDDSLISHVSVETDTLLQPTGDEWEVNDARLVVTVGLRPYRVTFGNISFG
jgi:hypothetical protein